MCNREGDSTFSIAVYGGGEGLFRRILLHFSRTSGCPGVERQFFSSFRALTTVSAPGVPESPGVSLPGDSALGLPINPQRKTTTTTTTTTIIIQSGEAPFYKARRLHPTLGS